MRLLCLMDFAFLDFPVFSRIDVGQSAPASCILSFSGFACLPHFWPDFFLTIPSSKALGHGALGNGCFSLLLVWWGMNFSILLIPVGLNVGLAGVTPLWPKNSFLFGRHRSLCPNVRRESKLDILKGKEPNYEHVTSVIQSVYFGFCFCFHRVSCKLKLYLFIIVAVPKAAVIKLNASHSCKCNYLVLFCEQGLLQ